jgi:hypothetical protein
MLTRRRGVRRYYRHLRAICTQHHTAVIPFISQAAFVEQAKRLRLTTDGAFIANSTEALTLCTIWRSTPPSLVAVARLNAITSVKVV